MISLAAVVAALPLVFPSWSATPYFDIQTHNPSRPAQPATCKVFAATWDQAQSLGDGSGALLLLLDYEMAVRKCMAEFGVALDGPRAVERALREQLKRRGIEI